MPNRNVNEAAPSQRAEGSNVDVIAIALLLLAFAFFTQVSEVVHFELGAHRVAFTHRRVGPVVVIPQPPRAPLPPLPFARD